MRRGYSNKSVKRGLSWLRLGCFFHNFLIVSPVIVLIYVQKGISVGDFFLIEGIFRIAAFLFEIPSGYLSDCFSRRRVMIMGALFRVFGFFTLILAYGFWGLVLGEALLGISGALFSGTLEAYTYDLMKRNKSQKHFLKEFGRVKTFGAIANFIAVILGGVLFTDIGGNGLLWVMVAFCVLTTFSFLFLPELSEVKRTVKHKAAIADAVSITYRTLKNAKLRNLIIFPSLFGAFTIVLLWLMQPVMKTAQVPVSLFGFYMGITNLSTIFFSKYAYKICAKFNEITVSVISIGAVFIGITMGLLATHVQIMPIVYVACALMAITRAVSMLNNLQYNTLIHHSIKSSERGTVLSTRAMVATISGAIFSIIAKFLIDDFGITATLIVMFVMTSLLIWSLKNVSKYIK